MITRLIIGGLAGGAVGFGLYRFVGCSTGACPITSNVWVSLLYGVVMGLLLAGGLR